MAISIELLKQLRNKTGVGMSHCKQALEASNGDQEEALNWLRKKGVANAMKKSDRLANEGLIGTLISSDKKSGSIIEVNSETDFVANNDIFQSLVTSVLPLVKKVKNIEQLNKEKIEGETVENKVISVTAQTGEKISLKRCQYVTVSSGIVNSYVHNAVKNNPNLGRIGVLLAITSDINNIEPLQDIAKKISMHIAAFSPISLDIKSIPQNVADQERNIFKHQAEESGKSAEVISKMIEGRIQKFYTESVLLEQKYVIDNNITINQAMKNFDKDNSCTSKIDSFVLFKVGEELKESK